MRHIEIIDRPNAKSRRRSVAEFVITISLWLVWFLMFAPLISTVVWGLSDQYSQTWLLFGNYSAGEIDVFLEQIVSVLLFSFAIIPAWIYYNIWRFRVNDRRCQGQPVNKSLEMQYISAFHHVLPEAVELLPYRKRGCLAFRINRTYLPACVDGAKKMQVNGAWRV